MLLLLQMNNLLATGGGGGPPVTVPNVVGQTQATGKSNLEAAGLVVNIFAAYSGVVTAGNIISQSPTAGSSVPNGSEVNIIVSAGPAPASSGNSNALFGTTLAIATTSLHGSLDTIH